MCKAIFTDKENIKAIYRGEAYNVRERLKSHLFNTKYLKEFNGPRRMDTTLSINNNKVNIDDSEFEGYVWYVSYYAAPNSTANLRRMIELEFDKKFGRPLYSKEKS